MQVVSRPSSPAPALAGLSDAFGPAKSLQVWAALPIVLVVVFGLVYFSDKARGGYKAEKIGQQGD